MPAFSVVVPFYNVREFLDEALQSVERQSFPDFEAILVDDGSTDGSSDIAKAFCARDKRFQYFHQENSGPSAARNAGVARASGAYLYFFDGDDLIEPDALHCCNEEFTRQAVDAVLFGCTVFSSEPSQRHSTATWVARRPQVDSPLYSDEFVIASIQQARYFVQPCCYAMRRAAIGNLRFIEGMLYEDNHYFAAMLLQKRIRVAVLDRPLFMRRFRSNSIMTSRRTAKNYESLYRLLREMCALTFPALAPVQRERVQLFVIGRLLGDLHNVSAEIGPGVRLRITNLLAAWHVATRISFRVLTLKRLLLAVAPELYGVKLLKRPVVKTWPTA
jgi:hypothetical protein